MPTMKMRNIFCLCCLALVAGYLPAQNTERTQPNTVDTRIQRAVAAVSADRLQASDLALVNFGTRHTLGTNLPPEKKAGVVQAQEWLTAQLQRLAAQCQGCLEVKTHTSTEGPSARIPQPTKLVTVYAVQKGSDAEASKRVILICAHYDTIAMARMNDPEAPAPGANDDGSGTSLVLEAARVLSQQKFPATIVYAIFPGEEQGLFGSKSFARSMARGWKLEAVLSNDIVGGDNTREQQGLARVFSEGIPAQLLAEGQMLGENDVPGLRRLRLLGAESDSPSRQLARYIASEVVRYLPESSVQPKLVFRQDRFLRGGDHTSFNEQGIAAVRITEFAENYDHQHQLPRVENGIEYGDLLKFVNFEYLAGVTRLNVATAGLLAAAPAAPAEVKLRTKELVNSSTLHWAASPDGLATGYEVLYRDTTSAQWEKVIPAGSQFEITIPYSKDNGVFAVRAYDADGHRSLPVYPLPER
jgi:hypothetical protein